MRAGGVQCARGRMGNVRVHDQPSLASQDSVGKENELMLTERAERREVPLLKCREAFPAFCKSTSPHLFRSLLLPAYATRGRGVDDVSSNGARSFARQTPRRHSRPNAESFELRGKTQPWLLRYPCRSGPAMPASQALHLMVRLGTRNNAFHSCVIPERTLYGSDGCADPQSLPHTAGKLRGLPGYATHKGG